MKGKTKELTRQDALRELKIRVEEIAKVQEELQKEEIDCETESENYREPLSIETERVVKILLSWGGGEDGYKLTFKDKKLIRGVYYMADWGQYAEIELSEEELSTVFDFYLYGECPA